MSAGEHTQTLYVSAEHPSLPGHFPGHPVVPGVVILDVVRASAERIVGSDYVLRHMPQVKFLQPLLPGQVASIALDEAVDTVGGQRVRFSVLIDIDISNPVVIAAGDLVFVRRVPHD